MEQFSSFDSSIIHYISHGKGPAIIFLHGWTSQAKHWLPYATALATDYRVLCLDARGHGRHNTTVNGAHVSDMARDLRQLIQQHHLTDVVLVGHSMGALTAWEYIRQFGCADLRGLCILDQSPCLVTNKAWPLGIYGDFDKARNDQFISELKEDFAEATLRLIAYGLNAQSLQRYESNTAEIQRMRDYQTRQSAGVLIECWESLTSADYRDVLPKINIPCLLIYGAQSQFYSIETAKYVARSIPDNTLLLYQDGDHSPHENIVRFLEDLRSFIHSSTGINAGQT